MTVATEGFTEKGLGEAGLKAIALKGLFKNIYIYSSNFKLKLILFVISKIPF